MTKSRAASPWSDEQLSALDRAGHRRLSVFKMIEDRAAYEGARREAARVGMARLKARRAGEGLPERPVVSDEMLELVTVREIELKDFLTGNADRQWRKLKDRQDVILATYLARAVLRLELGQEPTAPAVAAWRAAWLQRPAVRDDRSARRDLENVARLEAAGGPWHRG